MFMRNARAHLCRLDGVENFPNHQPSVGHGQQKTPVTKVVNPNLTGDFSYDKMKKKKNLSVDFRQRPPNIRLP